MGDVLHTLPALTDAAQAIPGIRFDWVVEEGFAQIPSWHETVERVIPVAIRRWRKAVFRAYQSGKEKPSRGRKGRQLRCYYRCPGAGEKRRAGDASGARH